MQKGRLIVIEGLDGSGKATQTELLYRALKDEGHEVDILSFPCYQDESSALVRMYLNGDFGDSPDDVGGYAASVFFAVDRYASYTTRWKKDYESGMLFLANRYTTSNAVFQTAKMPENEWGDYLDWLDDFEYNRMGIPAPDAVIYLDVSPETGSLLLRRRYAGDEEKKDIHERSLAYQQLSRKAAMFCAKRQHWTLIRCDEGGTMRKQEEIARDVLASVRERMF